MSATALRDAMREIALPEVKPKSGPTRRGPLGQFSYEIEDLRSWSLEISYVATRESLDDDFDIDIVDIDIVEIDLYTPAGRTTLDRSALHDEDRVRIEDAIREDLRLKAEAARYDDHQPGRERI